MIKTLAITPALVAVALIATGTSTPLQAASLEDELRYQFPTGVIDRVDLSNVNGSITCTGVDGDQIEIIAVRKIRAGSDADAEAYLEHIQIDIEEQGSTLKIETKLPKSSGGFWQWITGKRLNATIAYELRVPFHLAVKLESVNGAVNAESLTGSVELETVNGRIQARQIGSNVRMETVNGSIECALTTDGVFESLQFETVNGSIKVKLPAQCGFDLDVQTVNGGIHCDFDLPSDGVRQKRRLQAQVHGGGPSVRLATVNGSATVNTLAI